MHHYQIAVLPGDGIGPEVITESVQTLEALAELHGGFRLEIQHFDWGTERYLREGALMPQDGLAVLKRGGFDGILLGPVGDPRVPDHLGNDHGTVRSVPLSEHFVRRGEPMRGEISSSLAPVFAR